MPVRAAARVLACEVGVGEGVRDGSMDARGEPTMTRSRDVRQVAHEERMLDAGGCGRACRKLPRPAELSQNLRIHPRSLISGQRRLGPAFNASEAHDPATAYGRCACMAMASACPHAKHEGAGSTMHKCCIKGRKETLCFSRMQIAHMQRRQLLWLALYNLCVCEPKKWAASAPGRGFCPLVAPSNPDYVNQATISLCRNLAGVAEIDPKVCEFCQALPASPLS
eukprot:6201571-Pleurochrysis_carterae.AAC.7